MQISQRFSGLDEHKMLHSVLYVSGTVPTVNPGQIIEFADDQIEYRRSAPGTCVSALLSCVHAGLALCLSVGSVVILLNDCSACRFVRLSIV